jgi:hypothetical protein
MKYNNQSLNRREFLKQSFFTAGGLLVLPHTTGKLVMLQDWPTGETLGRNTVYLPSSLPIRSRPTIDGAVVRYLAEDECIPWYREVIGERPVGRPSKTWVETPEGYVYSPSLQKVQNIPNTPISELPDFGGERGVWVEVTQPFVQLELENPIPQSPWLKNAPSTFWRLYYSQVIWCDGIRTTEDGQTQYHLVEKYGYDSFWANATAFKPLSAEDISPINPEASGKRILVNVNQQTLSCFEENNEVFFCQISTGVKVDAFGLPDDTFKTPKGAYNIWRKAVGFHMGGGAREDGWDIIAVPWTLLFVGNGVAIHGAFWHNDFGTPKSHGCVNAKPEDAKWIFRWTSPQVSYYPGDVTITNFDSTIIEVIEPLY